MSTPSPRIRLAQASDDEFILGLAARFVGFELPAWRKPRDCVDGIRRELALHLQEQPAGSHVFVAEDEDGALAGFLHIQNETDYFTGTQNCHISDLAVAAAFEGRGIARALLAFAEQWARQHRCRRITLNVFPGNARARALYESQGYGTELLRLVKPIS